MSLPAQSKLAAVAAVCPKRYTILHFVAALLAALMVMALVLIVAVRQRRYRAPRIRRYQLILEEQSVNSQQRKPVAEQRAAIARAEQTTCAERAEQAQGRQSAKTPAATERAL